MTTTTTPITDDPMTAALITPDQERHYFGLITTVDSWFCILEKGKGKRPWDKTRDSIADRRVATKLSIECAKRDGGTYSIDQETLNFERTWVQFTLPSLQKLGISDLRVLAGRACHAKRIAIGETYQNKSGESKEKTALVFLELFEDTESCSAAADAFYGGSTRSSRAMPEGDLPADLGMTPEQQFALNSLPALLKASGNDPEKFKALITQNPLISKYYPADHPHVQALIGGTVADNDDDLPF